jgi:hypothetical protein
MAGGDPAIRKSIKTRGSFPTEEAATKLIYLAIRNLERAGRNVREWFAARNQFATMFEVLQCVTLSETRLCQPRDTKFMTLPTKPPLRTLTLQHE